VGKATGLRLNGRGVGFPVPVGQEFSFLYPVHAGSGVHPASYPAVTVGSFSAREADHSPPAYSEVKNMWMDSFTDHPREKGAFVNVQDGTH
jgi:hypothetical protein